MIKTSFIKKVLELCGELHVEHDNKRVNFYRFKEKLNKKGYILPGAGQAIIGSLWPLIVAFFMVITAFLVKYFWKPIKKLFKKK